MKRSLFLVSGLGIAAASCGGSPVLARAIHAPGSATSVSVRRTWFDGGLPGGCGSHRRRRSSPHAGYTLQDALAGA